MKIKHKKPKRVAKNPIPEWLQTIQLNSWEAELLISALLLYALFQVPEYLTIFFRKNIPDGNVLRFFATGLVDGIRLLRWGYIIHIIVRGIWVASVGFSFVFPLGIIKEKTGFRGRFREELEKDTNLSGFVLTLEQLSSIIYGISFMLFGLLLGGFAYLFILAALSVYGMVEAMANGQTWLVVISFIVFVSYLFLGLIMFIDFFTNGYFRREKSVAKWFYPLAMIFRVISFSILYRRSLLVLQTNLPTRWKHLLPLILVIFVGSYWYLGEIQNEMEYDEYYESNEASFNSKYYESTREFDEYLMVTIPDQIIDQNVLQVFVKDINLFNRAYASREFYILGENFDKQSSEEKVAFLKEALWVGIDSVRVIPDLFLETRHKTTFRSGYQMMVDLMPFQRGPHVLNVRIDTLLMGENMRKSMRKEKTQLGRIPFYYDKP